MIREDRMFLWLMVIAGSIQFLVSLLFRLGRIVQADYYGYCMIFSGFLFLLGAYGISLFSRIESKKIRHSLAILVVLYGCVSILTGVLSVFVLNTEQETISGIIFIALIGASILLYGWVLLGILAMIFSFALAYLYYVKDIPIMEYAIGSTGVLIMVFGLAMIGILYILATSFSMVLSPLMLIMEERFAKKP